MTSKMSQISAEMDEKNIPEQKRNDLIARVSSGMHEAEKKIDMVVEKKRPAANNKPDERDKAMLTIAKKIRDFADKTHNVVTLDGKNYVKVGVYQYLANLLHLTPSFEFEPESTQTEVWCTCELRNKDGEEVTHTTMYADKTEVFLRDKPDYAVLGMAQTRAFARAMKNLYGYLIELAGYQSVAIEEIELEVK